MSTTRSGSIKSVSIWTITSVPPARTRLVPDARASNAMASPSEDGASYLSEFIPLPEARSGLLRMSDRRAPGCCCERRVLHFFWRRKDTPQGAEQRRNAQGYFLRG